MENCWTSTTRWSAGARISIILRYQQLHCLADLYDFQVRRDACIRSLGRRCRSADYEYVPWFLVCDVRPWRGPVVPFIGSPQYKDGILCAATTEQKGGWPSRVLKAAYKADATPDAAMYADLAREAFGADTEETVAEARHFFRNQRLAEFAKREASMKRALAPPQPGMVTTVEELVLQCAGRNLGTGKMTNTNLKYLLGLVGYSASGPKPERIYRLFEGEPALAAYAELELAAVVQHAEEEEELADDTDTDSEEEDTNLCAVCHTSDQTPENPIFICACCGASCHCHCSREQERDLQDAWICDPCSSGTEFQPQRATSHHSKRRRGQTGAQKKRAKAKKAADRPPDSKGKRPAKRPRSSSDSGSSEPPRGERALRSSNKPTGKPSSKPSKKPSGQPSRRPRSKPSRKSSSSSSSSSSSNGSSSSSSSSGSSRSSGSSSWGPH